MVAGRKKVVDPLSCSPNGSHELLCEGGEIPLSHNTIQRTMRILLLFLGLTPQIIAAQSDTLDAFINTGQCVSHSMGLSALNGIPADVIVRINFSKNDSAIHQAVLNKLLGTQRPREISVHFLSEYTIRGAYVQGASSFALNTSGVIKTGALDDLPAITESLNMSRAAASRKPMVRALEIPLSASSHLWSGDRYTVVYDEFLVSLYQIDQDSVVAGSSAYSKSLMIPLHEMLSSNTALIWEGLGPNGLDTVQIERILDIHLTERSGVLATIVLTAKFGSSSRDVIANYDGEVFSAPRLLPKPPPSWNGHALITPSSSSYVNEHLICRFAPSDEAEPWGKRSFMSYLPAGNAPRIDTSYAACTYPKGLESRGFGQFLAAGLISQNFFVCGIVPVLVDLETCKESDLSIALGLQPRDYGMHQDAFYTQAMRVINNELVLVYTHKRKLHIASFTLPDLVLTSSNPIEPPVLNWASISLNESGELISLSDDRRSLIIHPRWTRRTSLR